MASADQLKALLRSYIDGDDQRFYAVAMQLAAHEAKLGHGKLAEDLRALIDEAKKKRATDKSIPIGRPRGELSGLLALSYPRSRLRDMVLDHDLLDRLQRIIREQRHASRILEHGLSPRRKLLLLGPPGTGKTMTASVLAGELGIPLFEIRLDVLITKYMGETAAKLRQVFDYTEHTRGAYFFDEFDSIGSHRGLLNEVGEIRRVLNSFLQMIEQEQSHSLIIAATNYADVLDRALFRRFDDVLHYTLPAEGQIAKLLEVRLLRYVSLPVSWARIAKSATGLSYAEVARAADEALKTSLIDTSAQLSESTILAMLEERQVLARRLRPDQD